MNNEKLNILLVEDDADDAFLVKKIFEKAGRNEVTLECFDLFQPALERLNQESIDCVLLDLFLPDSEGLNTLRKMRAQYPSLPIIILTNLDDESAAVESLNNGAQDYLVKGELSPNYFLRTIRYAIERHRIRLQLNETNARLEQLAFIDPLTGLLNRRGLQQILSGQIQRSSREFDLLALLIDLDNFKQVNDTLGHAVGDIVLKEITQRMKKSLRATDHASRIGGDEFLLLLPETRMAEGIRAAEKVRLAISGSPVILAPEKTVTVTASLGLVSVDPYASTIDELLSVTHSALFKSKRSGKNQVSYEVRGKVEDGENGVMSNIHRQLLQNPFRALKQDIFDLAGLNNVASEFLTRSTIKNFEMPDDFFRAGLENNVLTLIDHQCLRTCLKAASAVNSNKRCHLNVFPSTIIEISTRRLISELQESGNLKSGFCVEISEQQIVGDPSYLAGPVEEMKKAGIQVAIDDVGFGRSCFESLILLEPDIIKVDKGCITGVKKDKARLRSLKRILNVAKVLETEVIAEGVETQEDLDVLKDLGVKYGQGFFFEKPVECDALVSVG